MSVDWAKATEEQEANELASKVRAKLMSIVCFVVTSPIPSKEVPCSVAFWQKDELLDPYSINCVWLSLCCNALTKIVMPPFS